MIFSYPYSGTIMEGRLRRVVLLGLGLGHLFSFFHSFLVLCLFDYVCFCLLMFVYYLFIIYIYSRYFVYLFVYLFICVYMLVTSCLYVCIFLYLLGLG